MKKRRLFPGPPRSSEAASAARTAMGDFASADLGRNCASTCAISRPFDSHSNCATATARQHATIGDCRYDAEKLNAPLIAPQLTAQESAVAQQQTTQSLSIAEKKSGLRARENSECGAVGSGSKIRDSSRMRAKPCRLRIGAARAVWPRKRRCCPKNSQVHCEEVRCSYRGRWRHWWIHRAGALAIRSERSAL